MKLYQHILRAILRMQAPGRSRPDFRRFRRAIKSTRPGPAPIGDIFADFDTVGAFLREPVLDWVSIAESSGSDISPRQLRQGFDFVGQAIRFCALNGWDYTFSFSAIPFPGFSVQLSDNTSSEVQNGKRGWMDDNRGPISDWDDFECYDWPSRIWAINAMTRITCRRVPRGMKVMVIPGGVFEWTTWLMGLVPFCYALSDNPDLVDAVIEKVTGIIYAVVEDLVDEPELGGVFMGDDLGFSTGTMVSPAVIREKFLPRMKSIVELVHSAGKLFVLHSCGNMYELMDDIADMGVDAKHSFEDKILPVEEAHRRWGGRMAMIGGVDMNILARGSVDDVRKRSREILDACGPAGRFVMGTGNSVANYIPLKNYGALVSETRRWNREHFGRAQ